MASAHEPSGPITTVNASSRPEWRRDNWGGNLVVLSPQVSVSWACSNRLLATGRAPRKSARLKRVPPRVNQ